MLGPSGSVAAPRTLSLDSEPNAPKSALCRLAERLNEMDPASEPSCEALDGEAALCSPLE